MKTMMDYFFMVSNLQEYIADHHANPKHPRKKMLLSLKMAWKMLFLNQERTRNAIFTQHVVDP